MAMNAASIAKFRSSRWQVPQVRPLPLKVSLKKMSLPLAISAACGSGALEFHAPSNHAAARSAPATRSVGERCGSVE
jgi:hypothetical protein